MNRRLDQMLVVRPAQIDELAIVLAILKEAAQWMLSRGIDTWSDGNFDPAEIGSSLQHGEVYLAESGGDVVGTLTLQWTDVDLWGPKPDDAGYVHKLAVGRMWAGQGIGSYLLQWAECAAAKAGRQYLRLDCDARNPRLMRYYIEAGFNYRGKVEGRRWSASLYEKAIRP